MSFHSATSAAAAAGDNHASPSSAEKPIPQKLVTVALFSIPSPASCILVVKRLGVAATSSSQKATSSFSQQTAHNYVTSKVTRSLQDWQSLVSWINKALGQLIPPPPAPTNCGDIKIIETCILDLLDWIQERDVVTSSIAWFHFLSNEFAFQPPAIPLSSTKSHGSLTSLFFPSSTASSLLKSAPKEVDVHFDEARKAIITWQQFYAGFGRMNEKIGLGNREWARLSKEISARLSTLMEYQTSVAASSLPSGVPGSGSSSSLTSPTSNIPPPPSEYKKCVKFFDTWAVLLGRDSNHRLLALNDSILIALNATTIALNSLDYRIQTLQEYEDACKSTQKKLVVMDKLRASRSIQQDKVDASLEEMTMVKRIEKDAKESFKETTDSLRHELAIYTSRQEDRLEGIIDEFVKRQMESCEHLIAFLS